MAGSAWREHGGGGLHYGRGRPAESRAPCGQSQAPRPKVKLPTRTYFALVVLLSGGVLVGASRVSHLGTSRHGCMHVGSISLGKVARPAVQIASSCPHFPMHAHVRLLCNQNKQILPYTHNLAIKQQGEPAQSIDQGVAPSLDWQRHMKEVGETSNSFLTL